MDARSVLDTQILSARDDIRRAGDVLRDDSVGGDDVAAVEHLIDELRLRGLDLTDLENGLAAGEPLAVSWGRLQSVRTDIGESLRNSLAFLGSLFVQRERLDGDYGAVVTGLLAELSRVLPSNISWPTVT